MSRNVVGGEITGRSLCAGRPPETVVGLAQIAMCAKCVSEVCHLSESRKLQDNQLLMIVLIYVAHMSHIKKEKLRY